MTFVIQVVFDSLFHKSTEIPKPCATSVYHGQAMAWRNRSCVCVCAYSLDLVRMTHTTIIQRQFLYLSIYLYPSVSVSVYLSVYQSLSIYLCLSAHPSVFIHTYIYIQIHTYVLYITCTSINAHKSTRYKHT